MHASCRQAKKQASRQAGAHACTVYACMQAGVQAGRCRCQATHLQQSAAMAYAGEALQGTQQAGLSCQFRFCQLDLLLHNCLRSGGKRFAAIGCSAQGLRSRRRHCCCSCCCCCCCLRSRCCWCWCCRGLAWQGGGELLGTGHRCFSSLQLLRRLLLGAAAGCLRLAARLRRLQLPLIGGGALGGRRLRCLFRLPLLVLLPLLHLLLLLLGVPPGCLGGGPCGRFCCQTRAVVLIQPPKKARLKRRRAASWLRGMLRVCALPCCCLLGRGLTCLIPAALGTAQTRRQIACWHAPSCSTRGRPSRTHTTYCNRLCRPGCGQAWRQQQSSL